jgi:dTDP-4-dehydrorhamnose reductase
MKNDKVLVLGATGFLGSYFQEVLGNLGIGHTSGITNPTGRESDQYISSKLETKRDIERLLDSVNVSKVINCIALSDIDQCEQNPLAASWLNTELPLALSKKCKSIGAQFIHISTDAVFSGEEQLAKETSEPKPKSVYGLTKYQGEIAVCKEDSSSLICRVNFVGWNPRGKSLFNFFYTNLKANTAVTGFQDIFFTPMYAADTVAAILDLAFRGQSGLFHIAGSERISKFEFGRLVAERMNMDQSLIRGGSFQDSQFAATRTPDLSLSNVKIKSLGIEIPTLANGIERLVKEVESKNA